MVYNLFTSENVIGFDEILEHDEKYKPAIFCRQYTNKKQQNEKRKNMVRYMQLFYGEFSYEEGDHDESRQTFENILIQYFT